MKDETVFLTYDQSLELVERIAKRCLKFDHKMTENEKDAMAMLLSDIGVVVSDIVDVSRLADNYAINAEIVTPNDYNNYNMLSVKDNYLFKWIDGGKSYYCLSR